MCLQSKRANFDATHELEELLLEENPLKARKRKEGTDTESMTPEMRMMEEHFTVFDYTRTQRRSYYHAPNSSGAAAGSRSRTVPGSSASYHSPHPALTAPAASSPPLAAPQPQRPQAPFATEMTSLPSRSYTPGSDKAHVVSRTGDAIEQQIMEGGGLANVGSRDWSKQLDREPNGNGETTGGVGAGNGGPMQQQQHSHSPIVM